MGPWDALHFGTSGPEMAGVIDKLLTLPTSLLPTVAITTHELAHPHLVHLSAHPSKY